VEQPGVALLLFGVAVFLLVAVAGSIIFILRLTPWYKKARANRLASEAQAAQVNAAYAGAGMQVNKGDFFGSTIASALGEHAGVRYAHKLHPGGKNTPPYAEVSVPSALRGEFTVTREDSADIFFKDVGFTGRVNTGDAAFEKDYALQGASAGYVAALFADAHNRDIIRALFALGYDEVELSGGTITASKSKRTHFLDLPVVTGAVEQMARLQMAPGMDENAFRGGISTRRIQWALVAAVVASVPLMLSAMLDTHPLVEGWWDAILREARVLPVAFILFMALLIFGLRGRPDAHRELGLTLAVLPLLLAGGWCGVVVANQRLDATAPSVHEVRLLRKYGETYKRETLYYLELDSWRPERSFVRLKVPSEIYSGLKAGQTVRVDTHAGRLGIEWIASVNGAKL